MYSPPSLLMGPPQARYLRSQPEPDIELPFLHPNPPSPPSSPESPPYWGFTENNSRTHLSSGNPCLDFFFQVVLSTPPLKVVSLLSDAWAHNSLAAFKLVFHLRGVRGTGKSDREGFYASALWLHTHHPQTLALNIPSLAEFGYIKDLLEILFRLIHGFDTRQLSKEKRVQEKKQVTAQPNKNQEVWLKRRTNFRRVIARQDRLTNIRELDQVMLWYIY